MASNDLALTNIVDVTVSEVQTALGALNESNVALFTTDAYANSFGSLGYAIYLSPDSVATDFGSSSSTYLMANSLFSQQPNILANGGYLAVIPFVTAVQHFALSGVPASGTFTLSYLGNPTANINWNDTTSQIQVKVRAVVGLEQAVVTGTLAGQAINISFLGVYGPVSLLTVGGAGLQTSAPAAITITPTTTTVGETMAQAITRSIGLIPYFGIVANQIFDQADTLAAAAVTQAQNKMELFVANQEADIQAGGTLDLLRSGSFHKSRGLYYGSDDTQDCLDFMAGYAGRGFSTNFSGSATTQNMQLKQLIGVQPDPSIDQSIYTLAKTAGADGYASFAGISGVYTSGENQYFDQVYNLGWFVDALQVALFNYLASAATKIPQTESGMDGLKSVVRQVCLQAVNNSYVAAGQWNSATTFGNQQNFLLNIQQAGFYVYSTPISQQSQADRAARIAPLIQIALKEAGAINSVIVNVFVNP